MATVSFLRSSDGASLGLSGIGLFGSTFGQSTNVGSYQDSTYETDSNGTQQGKTLSNIKWAHAQSGYVNGANLLNLLAIPNTDSTINIRFTHTSQVSLVNARLWITDRSSTTGIPAGVTTKISQLIHTGVSQVANGLGNSTWSTLGGTGYLSLSNSPGSGLLAVTGANARHDFFIAVSQSPDSVGSKLSTLRFMAEYL
jgi:hypothetical protein